MSFEKLIPVGVRPDNPLDVICEILSLAGELPWQSAGELLGDRATKPSARLGFVKSKLFLFSLEIWDELDDFPIGGSLASVGFFSGLILASSEVPNKLEGVLNFSTLRFEEVRDTWKKLPRELLMKNPFLIPFFSYFTGLGLFSALFSFIEGVHSICVGSVFTSWEGKILFLMNRILRLCFLVCRILVALRLSRLAVAFFSLFS